MLDTEHMKPHVRRLVENPDQLMFEMYLILRMDGPANTHRLKATLHNPLVGFSTVTTRLQALRALGWIQTDKHGVHSGRHM